MTVPARKRRPPIRMCVVTDSTNIAAVGYRKETSTMRVRFRDGSEYEYANITPYRYAELVGAESIGVYFAAHIRKNPDYPCLRKRRKRVRASAS